MSLKRSFAWITLLAAAACAAPARGPAPVAPGLSLDQAAATITPGDVFARIAFLAADEMRGRETPSPELAIAANYLVSQYRLWGMQAGGESGSFYQWWPYPLRRLNAAGVAFEVQGSGGTQRLELGRDYYTAGGTGQPIRQAALVWAGSGPDALLTEGVLRDRVVAMALPGAYSRDWRLERSRQTRAARRAGAAAVVHVLDDAWTADSIARYGQPSRSPVRTLGGELAFPEFFVTHAAAQRLLSAAGLAPDALAARGAAQLVALPGLTVSAGVPNELVDEARAPNVVAVLPGSDPALRDEYVILSAHLDHVGVGQPVDGDSIYNGADDDASGTTALLEVAEAFVRLGQRPARSIVFLHVSGEEHGLLGSQWYSDHPTLPLDRIVANVNVDMIGRNNPDSVVVIGMGYSSLGPQVRAVAAGHPELGLTLSDDPWPQERFFFRSDHFNFARKEVPALFFFSGTHADYHRPSDEVELIDTQKATRISRMIFYLVNDIANAPGRPQWDPAGLEEVRRLTR